ncbi:MAG: hypothetical protein RL708_2412 [Bacteroidota bacterium]|jgi:hypothetical protein
MPYLLKKMLLQNSTQIFFKQTIKKTILTGSIFLKNYTKQVWCNVGTITSAKPFFNNLV